MANFSSYKIKSGKSALTILEQIKQNRMIGIIWSLVSSKQELAPIDFSEFKNKCTGKNFF